MSGCSVTEGERAQSRCPAVNHQEDNAVDCIKTLARLEFFEQMHRTAPGIDWREMERENILAAMERKRGASRNRHCIKTGVWHELGSRNLAGRIHAAALSSDQETLYAGAARGGLWKKARKDRRWIPISDNVFGGAHEIGVIPAKNGARDILIYFWSNWWAFFWNKPEALTFVWRSIDGGMTWHEPVGLNRLSGAKRLLVMNDLDHTVFLLARKNEQWQILASTDQGESFQYRRGLSTCGDIWTPVTYNGPLYLLDAHKIMQTTDGGATWTPTGSEIPATSDTLLLAGSGAQGLHFHTALRQADSNWHIWCSHDGAETWTMSRKTGKYFDFWRSLGASSLDPDLATYGSADLFITRDGGTFWKKIHSALMYYQDPAHYLHPDICGIYALPVPDTPSGEIWYLATDGGLYDSKDQLESVNNLSLFGHGVSQYYGVLTSRRYANLIAAGSQDQGYQRGKSLGEPPYTPGPWVNFKQVVSGDYGHLTSSNGTHDLVYSVYPDFSDFNIPGFIMAIEGEEDPEALNGSSRPAMNFPPNENYPWLPAIRADPVDPEVVYFCASKLWRYYRVSKKVWKREVYGEKDFSPGFLTAMAFSPVDPQLAFAATNDGRLYRSTDQAKTWTQSESIGPEYLYYYGTSLLPSTVDPDVCWVAGSGYSNAPVFRTLDGGVTWEPESDGLPKTLVYCLAEAPDQSGRIFCGSECGAWVYDPVSRKWADLLDAEAPIITYLCCETVPSKNLIRFGTFGRGIWDFYLNTSGYFPYGELRGQANVLALENHAKPLIGKPTTFLIHGCRPDAAGMLAFSPALDEIPLLGGTFLLDPQRLNFIPFNASSNGEGTVILEIPNDPAYVDLEVYFQAGAHDPTQSQNWGLSNGLRAVIGR
jgi:photosystem II stability/assembly factor-like uncharacterized protein